MLSIAQFGPLNYTILGVYLALMFVVGVLVAGKQRTTEDYFLAGRRMPWLVVAMSMFASITSATSYMGIPGDAYSENCSLILVGVASLLVAPLLIGVFYPFYHRLGVTTSFEYIGHRFGQPARLSVSALFLLARLGWLGVVIYSPALAISVTTGVNLYFAIVLMGILAISYTVIGGLAAVLWTDMLQFIILTGGAIWVAVTLISSVPDGLEGIMTTAREADHLLRWDVNMVSMSATVVLFSYFLNLMQDYGADQVTVQRLMSTKTFGGMARATILNAVFDLVIVGLLLFLGLGMFAYYQNFPELLPQDITGAKVLPHYIVHALPNGVSGLLITALFAAAMSSMDSGINTLATVIINDFVKPLRRHDSGEEHDVFLARVLTLLLGVLAIGAACYASTYNDRVLKAAAALLSLFSGPILALFLLGMLTRRGNYYGWCFAAVVSIGSSVWLQNYTFSESGLGIHWTFYFPFSFGICFLSSLAISCVWPGKQSSPELTVWGTKDPHP